MFFFLKIIKPFFLPPTLIALAMVVSLVCLIRKKYKWGKIFLLVALGMYYVLSIDPVSYLLEKSLATQEAAETALSDAEIIVVLAGGAEENREGFSALSGASQQRLLHGIELYRALNGKIPILYSGGSGDPFNPVSHEAVFAKQYAVSVGIPEQNFWIETASRTTAESGIAVKKFLGLRFPYTEKHRIILVTSGRHMLRALRVMEKVGIDARPSFADFPTNALRVTPLSFFPSAGVLSSSVESIHEWVGIAGYWVLGKI